MNYTNTPHMTLHIDIDRVASAVLSKLDCESSHEAIAQLLEETLDSAVLSEQVTYLIADKYADYVAQQYALNATMAQSVTEFIDNMTEVGGVYIEQDTEY